MAAKTPNTYFQSQQGKWTSNPAYQAAAAGQAQKDIAAFGGMANLGIANQNAIGQYGAGRNAALSNQAVAAANAYGQMQNSYLNTMGQLGHIGSALTAAGLGAGAQSSSSSQRSSSSQNSSASQYGAASQYGQMGAGLGTGAGFASGGPEGRISSGMTGGYGGFGGTFGGASGSNAMRSSNEASSASSMSSNTASTGATSAERTGMMNQGYGFLSGLMNAINKPTGIASNLSSQMGTQFNQNRAAMMDPSVMNSLNANLMSGYGALSNLYGQADYGFNTSTAGGPIKKY